MSNKTQLQANNTTLDGYIARINAAKEVAAGLPEAGGSGGGAEWNQLSSLPTTYAIGDLHTTYYLEVPKTVLGYVFSVQQYLGMAEDILIRNGTNSYKTLYETYYSMSKIIIDTNPVESTADYDIIKIQVMAADDWWYAPIYAKS